MGLPELLLRRSQWEGECLIWRGSKTKGYGTVMWKGRQRYAHHISWMEHFGGEPIGLDFCHSCDVKARINPHHIWLGTHRENMADCRVKRGYRHGANHPRAKLTEDDVREIRKSEATNRALAKVYGVSHGVIQNIRTYSSWQHVKGVQS